MTETETAVLYRIISERVRKERTRLGLRQQQLADKVGVDRTSIANVETGRQRPPLHVLWSIAEHLGLTVTELIPSKEEIAAAVDTPVLSDRALEKIKEAAEGNATTALRLTRFLEEELEDKTEDE